MMQPRTVSWFLVGALCASLALNVVLGRAAAHGSTAAEPPALPSMLDLSPQQVQRLLACREDCCDERESLQQAIRDVETQLHSALSVADVDVARARDLAARLGELRARCLQTGVETILQVREVLTPQQIEQLIECFESGCRVATRE
jgi:Spy/CpxP family protein refolding chaperone